MDMEKKFIVLRTKIDNELRFTNYRISLDGTILSRKNKVVDKTTDKSGNSYYVIMYNGIAYKKTKDELLKENF